jgi:hypothetical protein
MSLIEILRIKKSNLDQIINIAFLVIAVLVAINIHQKQNKKFAQIFQIRDVENERNEILLRIGNLNKRIGLYKETLKPMEQREIINTITNLAQATDTKIISLKPQEKATREKKSKIYNQAFFRLDIQADGYHQLAKFISRLENNPILFIIESFQVKGVLPTRAELTVRPEKMQADLIISALFLED